MDNIDISEKVIIFPTDTVYGIGAKWNDYKTVNKIFEIKIRELKKPLAILIANFDQIKDYIEINNSHTLELINKYWPGATTFVFKKKKDLEYPYETIAFRIPNSKVALKILNKFGPLATTSVNISGEEPINNIDEIIEKYQDKVDYIFTDEAVFSSISSTVVDLTTNEIKILRQGSVKIEI